MLERHHDICGRVPEQRPGEDRPAAEAIGEKAAEKRADEEAGEQGGDEARDARRPEQTLGPGGEQTGLDQARRDIGGKQEVIEFEEHAEAQEHDDLPDRARRRQPVDAGRNRALA